MQEKLYFKPGNYGKGIKKLEKQTGQRVEIDAKGKRNHKALKLVCLLLFLLTLIIFVIWLLRGRTTTTGRYPENLRSESLECVSPSIIYEKITAPHPASSELKITAIFNDSGALASASMQYALIYESEVEAYSAEAVAHANFNIGLASRNFSSEKFSNKFTILDNKLVVSLYVTAKEINEYTHDYFLIPDANLKGIDEYKTNYNAQGFYCTSSFFE